MRCTGSPKLAEKVNEDGKERELKKYWIFVERNEVWRMLRALK